MLDMNNLYLTANRCYSTDIIYTIKTNEKKVV